MSNSEVDGLRDRIMNEGSIPNRRRLLENLLEIADQSSYKRGFKEAEATFKAHYLQKISEARKDERRKARQLYAKRNPLITRQGIADLLGISRPTLNKWIDDPELFTIGAIRRLKQQEDTKKAGDV